MQFLSAALAGCCVLCCVAQVGRAPEQRFVKHVLTTEFISEGVAIADVNRDGKPDIIAGAYWFEAPKWTRHAFAPPKHYDPSTQFSNSFLDFSLDVNQDGWPDVVRISLPGEEAVWYENPGVRAGAGVEPGAAGGADAGSAGAGAAGGQRASMSAAGDTGAGVVEGGAARGQRAGVSAAGAAGAAGTAAGADAESAADAGMGAGAAGGAGYWRMHALLSNAGNESPAMVDVDGDGRPDLLCNDPIAKEMIWMQPPTKKGDTSWTRHVIARGDVGTGRYTHGLGLIDMNGDGRKDVVITKGWWECPADRTQENWTFHPADLGDDCSQIYALDVKGDGQQALVSASAHRYGIWWHERTDTGWVHHLIFDKVSETHAMALADVNGDGHPDLVTGKRYYAHNGEDPGAHEPSLLYWFEFKPGAKPEWVPHLIDDDSGVGLQVLVQDLNGDGLKDIIVSNKKGVFFFEQVRN